MSLTVQELKILRWLYTTTINKVALHVYVIFSLWIYDD